MNRKICVNLNVKRWKTLINFIKIKLVKKNYYKKLINVKYCAINL
jgi:hypothetical protein